MSIDAPELLPQETETSNSFPVLSRALSLHGGGNPQALALRQRGIEDREHIAQQNFEVRAQQQELQKVSTLATLLKERMRIADSMEAQRQTMHATKALTQISPDDPLFESKLADIAQNHPLAMKDETIQKAIAFRYEHAKILDEATRRKAAFDAQLANPATGITAPTGMETGRIAITPAGERDVAFERPRVEQPDKSLPFTAIHAHAKSLADIDSHQAIIKFYNQQIMRDPKVADYGETQKALSTSRAAIAGAQAMKAELETRFKDLAPPHPPLGDNSGFEASEDATGTATVPPAPQISEQDQQAISWAAANPNDPRAAKIKQLHGIQ